MDVDDIKIENDGLVTNVLIHPTPMTVTYIFQDENGNERPATQEDLELYQALAAGKRGFTYNDTPTDSFQSSKESVTAVKK